MLHPLLRLLPLNSCVMYLPGHALRTTQCFSFAQSIPLNGDKSLPGRALYIQLWLCLTLKISPIHVSTRYSHNRMYKHGPFILIHGDAEVGLPSIKY